MPRARRLPVSLALIATLAALPSFARPVEMILSVVVNGEKKGEFFVRRSEDGDMLIRPEDLGAVGLKDVAGKVETIDGTQYLSLRSIAGVSVVFVERTLTLEVVADPRLLPKRTIDFTPERRKTVLYPKDPSAFLNYGVNFTEGTLPGARDVSVTAQLGVRPGDVLFLSDASYDRSSATERFVRLQTSATYDWRKEMRRLVAGDFFASSGELGSTLNLGGVSVSRVFRIDPYFIGYPLADFSGVVALPSDAEIFINGARVRTEKLAPGGFELKNISYFGGVGDVVVVIKDPFGREQRISYPFYFTDAILREGLHEYSYNAGAQRKEFGVESNRYGGAAFSAFHRYGASDRLTVGLRAEGADGQIGRAHV